MKLTKKAERTAKTELMVVTFRKMNWAVKNLGTFCRWKELYDGGMIQTKLTIYQIVDDEGTTFYLVGDMFGKVAATTTETKAEVLGWLKEHGYKPEKQWYIEDYGMSEETWNVWNGNGEEEEQ